MRSQKWNALIHIKNDSCVDYRKFSLLVSEQRDILARVLLRVISTWRQYIGRKTCFHNEQEAGRANFITRPKAEGGRVKRQSDVSDILRGAPRNYKSFKSAVRSSALDKENGTTAVQPVW